MTGSGQAGETSPFHEGERAAQARAGVRERTEARARRIIRDFLPEQHRAFYAMLPCLVVAARDAADRPWATLLTGQPGFSHSPDPAWLQVDAQPDEGDALHDTILQGAPVGVLGIELHTRRRNRVNGVVAASRPGGFRLRVAQAFGNCPRYINRRRWRFAEEPPAVGAPRIRRALDAESRAWIAGADTLFVATGAGAGMGGAIHGMDASHRGGVPGFVEIHGESRLVIPDYAGNNHFNTIGNLALDPRIGLLFVDFATGGLMQLSGRARVDWCATEATHRDGIQRLVTVDIERVVRRDRVMPLRWEAG